jgi:hypothetical protein
VQQASDGEVQVVSAKGGFALGVLQNDPAAVDRAADLAIYGVTKVIANVSAAGMGLSVGSALISAAGGKAIKASTGGTAYVWGRAIEAVSTSTGSGAVVISALITHEGPSSSA